MRSLKIMICDGAIKISVQRYRGDTLAFCISRCRRFSSRTPLYPFIYTPSLSINLSAPFFWNCANYHKGAQHPRNNNNSKRILASSIQRKPIHNFVPGLLYLCRLWRNLRPSCALTLQSILAFLDNRKDTPRSPYKDVNGVVERKLLTRYSYWIISKPRSPCTLVKTIRHFSCI